MYSTIDLIPRDLCLLFNVSSHRILFLYVCWLFYVPFVNISLIRDVTIVFEGLQHLDLNSAPTALKHGEIYALTRSLGSRPRFHPRTAPYSHDTTLCDKRREYWRPQDSHRSLRGWGLGWKRSVERRTITSYIQWAYNHTPRFLFYLPFHNLSMLFFAFMEKSLIFYACNLTCSHHNTPLFTSINWDSTCSLKIRDINPCLWLVDTECTELIQVWCIVPSGVARYWSLPVEGP